LPSYKLIEIEENSAIGDFSENFTLRFNDPNFENLVKKIKQDTLQSELKWQKYESGWKYIDTVRENVVINVYINVKNKTLSYLYIEE
jgi:hypothetical protein